MKIEQKANCIYWNEECPVCPKKIRYFITDFFGNESEVGKVEFYCWKIIPQIVVYGMLLAMIGVLIDIFRDFYK